MTSINTNVAAYFAQSNLRSAQADSTNSIGRLSSGNRIIRAADDVAGLSVGTVLATSVNTLRTAFTNTQQANSLLQVADGGLDNVTQLLQRQKALSVQATAGTLSADERSFLNQEFQALTSEIDRLVENTKFNQVTLLDGSIFDDANLKTNTITIAGTGGANEFNGTVAELKTGVVANDIDALVDAINPAAPTTSGFQTNDVTDNAAFVGDIYGDGARFDVEYLSANNVQVQIEVGTITYTGAFNTAAAAPAVNLIGVDSRTGLNEGSFSLNLTTQAVDDINDAQNYEDRLNNVLSRVSFFQERDVESTGSGLLDASTAVTRLSDYENARVTDVRVTAADGTNAGIIEIDMGGRTYVNNAIILAAGTVAAGEFLLTEDNVATSNNRIGFTVGNAITAGDAINTQANALRLENDLKAFFRVGTGDTALNFQTGATAADSIAVQVKSVDSESLGLEGLDILTVENANAAGAAIDAAINTVTAVRADVGALQSRFDFAGANLQTSIQNVDAARGTFLDADISEESSDFAQSQVLLQASISVLAQANLLPQNLLKLIG